MSLSPLLSGSLALILAAAVVVLLQYSPDEKQLGAIVVTHLDVVVEPW